MRLELNKKNVIVVDIEESFQRIQQDIDQLQIWEEKWRVKFNLSKHEVLHFML